MVAKDPRSSEILKRVLRGRDINRYHFEWADLWLIATLPSWNLSIDDYPAVRDYLLQFGEERLIQEGLTLPGGGKSRSKTSYKWFELQSTCAYHESFSEQKLVWIELVNKGRFAVDDDGMFIEATAFMLVGERLKYLCAFLNSDLAFWYIHHAAPTSGMGRLRWKKTYVELLPVAIPPKAVEARIIELVDEAQSVSRTDENKLVEIESSINDLIFEIYGLSSEERTTVLSINDE